MSFQLDFEDAVFSCRRQHFVASRWPCKAAAEAHGQAGTVIALPARQGKPLTPPAAYAHTQRAAIAYTMASACPSLEIATTVTMSLCTILTILSGFMIRESAIPVSTGLA